VDTITRTLFESPFWFVVSLVLVDMILLAMWVRRRTRGLARAAGIVAAVAVVVLVLAAVVVTDRERITDAIELMAQDASAGKVEALERFLDDEVTVSLVEFGPARTDKAGAVAAAAGSLERLNINKVRVTSVEVDMQPRPLAVVTTVLQGEGAETGRLAVALRWRLRWVRRPEGWRIIVVEPPQRAGPGG